MTSDSKISPQKTWVPIGVMIAGLALFFWAGVSYAKILTKLETIESKQDIQIRDAVSVKTLRQWLELFKATNPTLTVPDFPK